MRNITILNFSARTNGNCAEIANIIKATYSSTNVCAFLISEVFEPCNGCDYQCLKPGANCPNITKAQLDLMEQILASDLLYYVIPNYCGVPCANYYAFNERNVGFFNSDRALIEKFASLEKRYIMVSNTEGTAFESVPIQQSRANGGKMLYLKTSNYAKSSIAGDLMTSSKAKSDLTTFLAEDL